MVCWRCAASGADPGFVNVEPADAVRGGLRFLENNAAQSGSDMVIDFLPLFVSGQDNFTNMVPDLNIFNPDTHAIPRIMRFPQPIQQGLVLHDNTAWENDRKILGEYVGTAGKVFICGAELIVVPILKELM